MPTHFHITVLLLLSSAAAAVPRRRILHEPFFPQDSSPPSSPNSPPFFPSYPIPPPPPALISTLPANVSSLGAKPKSASSKLIIGAVAAVIVAVAIVSLVVFLHLHRRSRENPRSTPPFDHSKSRRSDAFTNSSAATFHQAPYDNHHRQLPELRRPSQTSSEFLYLGTMANSHAGIPGTITSANVGDASNSRKLDSPELRPLPPLMQNHRNNADLDDEEFYSPKGSLSGSIGTGSASRRAFAAIEVENFKAYALNSSSTCSSSATRSRSGSPARSISLSLSPANSLSSGNSIPKSPDLIEIQPLRQISSSAQPPDSLSPESESPSPLSSYSRRSEESSPTISNGSNQKMEFPVRIISSAPPPPPPPPPPPLSLSKVRECPPKPPIPHGKNPFSERLPALGTPLRPTAISSLELPKNESESVVEKDEDSGEHEETSTKTKLKPLHWDKVKASSDKEMVWDQIKCSSFKLNEEMIETLFVANTSKPSPKEATRWHVLPSPGQDNGIRVLDPKKAQNIAILLRALNVTVEEVCEGLLEGNTETLGTDLLESLLKMAPTKEEERKLKEYKDVSPVKLGAAERFLKTILDIPYAFKRLDAMLYASNFESEVDYLKKSFATLEAACEELRTSKMFLKLLEAVLKTGNRMNVGTNRGDAHAFKLDTLLKLADVKGADGRTTLLHFVVQEIIRSEGARLTNGNTNDDSSVNDDAKCRKLGLQVVSKLSLELSNVKKAASMDAEVLSSDVSKLSKGIGNIGEVVRLNETMHSEESRSCGKFSESMNSFMKKAEDEIIRIQAVESVALSLVKEITEYFHGNSVREEAHPFRIFMVVRDFLTVLDRVCKEVGMINERTVVSSVNYKFPIPVNPMLQQPIGGFSSSRQYNFSDEDH